MHYSFSVQIAFAEDYGRDRFDAIDGVKILNFQKHGSVANMIIKGDRAHVTDVMRGMSPLVLDVLPLTLEEVFTYEMEALGYSFNLD